MKQVILILLVGMFLISILGCNLGLRSPFQKKTTAGEKLVEGVKEKAKITAYMMSGTNWLFSVLILVAVGGLALFLALRIKEGLAISAACVGGAALVVAFARWGWLIGLITIAVVVVLVISKLKNFKDIGVFAVQYAERLKAVIPSKKINDFNKAVFQPKSVKDGIRKIRKNGDS